ncbi:fungal-specific transcription factor domain-containing protein [Hypoxylon trugodes]|uniref:fungal-specific transcription factor domain-containing protein n=1 Tax=Hypoxylon trugodes TaxID=326681 RepID=UPI00218DC226|nr:fungal-specific transcription factor domain-containing protein [Hypoxylon trugodes]KAI1391590.1 fungal-specific transcription factor domain-containing protein [Hypoxylon trugodes]
MGGDATVSRSRSFTGCKTCRTRHAKCDEGKPECEVCKRVGITCEGYEPQLFWITDDSVPDVSTSTELRKNNRGAGFRYPLFSEGYRRKMSVRMSESMCKSSATELLLQIDSKCESCEAGRLYSEHIVLGPFSVFDAKHSEPIMDVLPSTPDDPVGPGSYAMFLDTCHNREEQFEGADQQNWVEFTSEMNMDMFLSPVDPSLNNQSQDHQNLMGLSGLEASNFLNLDSEYEIGIEPMIDNVATGGNESLANPRRQEGEDDEARAIIPLTPSLGSQGIRDYDSSGTLDQAEHLLRYYKHRITQPTSRIQAQRKSPWQILFLPCALETFAEITLFGRASHTRSAVLYSVLANSAFQLHTATSEKADPISSRWLELGTKHRDTAKDHLRQALRTEMYGPNKSKYKELLMAMLGCAITVLRGNAQTFKYLLLGAERLIRLRGLDSKKTFKVRLLHHMYTYLRIMAESTAAGTEFKEHLDEQFELTTPSAVTLRQFHVAEESLTLGLDPEQEKVTDLGYNDIHLEVQGTWKETLFPTIYGIPESLITLLSQVISAANGKARLESIAQKDADVSAALASHIKTLENSVWSWTLPAAQLGPARPQTDERQDLLENPNTRFMVLAMHQAVIIYFYRRIYNMSAMMLQHLVKQTLDYLQPCVDAGIEDEDFAASIAWPAFIAGCEATSPELQARAQESISIIESRAAVFTPEPASVVIAKVWEQRWDTGDWTLSWPAVVPPAIT